MNTKQSGPTKPVPGMSEREAVRELAEMILASDLCIYFNASNKRRTAIGHVAWKIDSWAHRYVHCLSTFSVSYLAQQAAGMAYDRYITDERNQREWNVRLVLNPYHRAQYWISHLRCQL